MKNYFKILYKKLFRGTSSLKDYEVTCYVRGWMSNEVVLYREDVKAVDSYEAESKSFDNNYKLIFSRISDKEKVPRLSGVRWEVIEVGTGEIRKCNTDCGDITS